MIMLLGRCCHVLTLEPVLTTYCKKRCNLLQNKQLFEPNISATDNDHLWCFSENY